MSSGTRSNPYQSMGDLLSRVNDFKLIDSTLREGEQFSNSYFTRETKIKMFATPPPLTRSRRLLTLTWSSLAQLC